MPGFGDGNERKDRNRHERQQTNRIMILAWIIIVSALSALLGLLVLAFVDDWKATLFAVMTMAIIFLVVNAIIWAIEKVSGS